jgi:hypothetical protein
MDAKGNTMKKMNMRELIAVILMSVCLLVACDSDKPGASPDVLHDTILVALLADFFIAEGAMIQLEYIQQKQPDSGVPLYREIFRKHGTTREAFIHSLEYHAQQPEKLDRLYDLAIQQLQMEQEVLNQKKEKETAENEM